MPGFPKTSFRWREPRFRSRRASIAARGRLLRLLGAVVLSSGAFLLVLALRYQAPIAKPLFALAAIVVFIVAVSVVHATVPPYVVVTGSRIYRGLNDETADEWRYRDIAHCEFSSKAIAGTVYRTMVIETTRGDRDLVVIPPTVSVVALTAFLAAQGVRSRGGPSPAHPDEGGGPGAGRA